MATAHELLSMLDTESMKIIQAVNILKEVQFSAKGTLARIAIETTKDPRRKRDICQVTAITRFMLDDVTSQVERLEEQFTRMLRSRVIAYSHIAYSQEKE